MKCKEQFVDEDAFKTCTRILCLAFFIDSLEITKFPANYVENDKRDLNAIWAMRNFFLYVAH